MARYSTKFALIFTPSFNGDKPYYMKVNKTPYRAKQKIWLQELNTQIEAHLSEPQLTAKKLALCLDISRRQLFRKVKALTGQTLNEYINTMRFQKAKEYLEHNTYKTVAETAHAVGFKDPGYFARQFKKRYGQLPSEV